MNILVSQVALLVTMFAAVFAAPVEDDGRTDRNPDLVQDRQLADLNHLTEELVNLRVSASDILTRVDTTLLALQPFMIHNIRKRQTSVDASVENGPNGPRGSVDVNHKDSSGGNYGAGISHDNSGTSVHGGYDKTFNDGNSKVSVSGGRTSGGDNYGKASISHTFGNGR